MIDRMFAAAALAASAPVLAQPATPPAPPAAAVHVAAEAVDPARMAAAERMIDAAMPGEWLAALLRQTVDESAAEAEAAAARDAEAIARDPHHVERTRLSERAVAAEMVRLFSQIGPELRGSLVRFYAQRMAAAELSQTAEFYASPAGQRLMQESLAMHGAPEFEQMANEAGPAMIAMLPGIEQRLAAATAHLPAPWKYVPKEGGGISAEILAAMAAAAPPEASSTPAASPPADPAKVAAARRVVDLLTPPGYFRDAFPIQPLVDAMLALRVGDFGFPLPPESGIRPEATVGEALAAQDPTLRELVRVGTRFADEEVGRAMAAFEPIFRRHLPAIYARHFSLEELGQFETFYASPAGRQFAAVSTGMLRDPALVGDAVRLMPRLIKEGPAMMQRVAAATAHLPPPPAPPEAEAEERPAEGQRRRRRR